MDKSSSLLLGFLSFSTYVLFVLAFPFRSGSPLWPPSAPHYHFPEHDSSDKLVFNEISRKGDLFSPAFYSQIAHQFHNHVGPVPHGVLDFVQNNVRRTEKHKEQPPMMAVAHPPPMSGPQQPPGGAGAMRPPGPSGMSQAMGAGAHPAAGQAMGAGAHPAAGQAMGAGAHPAAGQAMGAAARPTAGQAMGAAARPAAATPPGKPSFNANADIADENVFLFIAIGIAAILAKARGTDITFFGPVVGRRSVVEIQASNDEIAGQILVRGLEMDAAASNNSNAVRSACAQRAACEVPDNARILIEVLDIVAWMSEMGLDWISVSPDHVIDVIGKLREGADQGNSSRFCGDIFPCPQLALCNNCKLEEEVQHIR